MCQVMEKWEIIKKAAPTLLSTEYETDGNYPTYTAFYEIDYLDKESVPKLSFLANPTTRVSVFDFDQLSPGPYFHEKRRMLLFGTYDVEAKMNVLYTLGTTQTVTVSLPDIYRAILAFEQERKDPEKENLFFSKNLDGATYISDAFELLRFEQSIEKESAIIFPLEKIYVKDYDYHDQEKWLDDHYISHEYQFNFNGFDISEVTDKNNNSYWATILKRPLDDGTKFIVRIFDKKINPMFLPHSDLRVKTDHGVEYDMD